MGLQVIIFSHPNRSFKSFRRLSKHNNCHSIAFLLALFFWFFFAIPPRSMQQFFFCCYSECQHTHTRIYWLLSIWRGGWGLGGEERKGMVSAYEGRVARKDISQKGHACGKVRLCNWTKSESKAQQMLGLPAPPTCPAPLLSLFLCRTPSMSWPKIPHGCCPFNIYCCFVAATISVSVSIWSFKFLCSFQLQVQLQVQVQLRVALPLSCHRTRINSLDSDCICKQLSAVYFLHPASCSLHLSLPDKCSFDQICLLLPVCVYVCVCQPQDTKGSFFSSPLLWKRNIVIVIE